MAKWNRRFWVKLLVGIAYGILAVDVLVLAVLVVPLRASSQVSAETRGLPTRPTETVADQILILPTHDPSKPWPTRTPVPTATPWLVAAVRLAAQRQAELASMRNAAQMSAMSAEAVPEPGPDGTSIPTVSSPTVLVPTAASASSGGPQGLARQSQHQPADTDRRAATLQVGAIPAGSPSPTLTVPSSVESSGAITPTVALPATTPDAGTSEPSPTLTPVTPEPSGSKASGDEAQYTAYVEGHYNTIADQPLEITAVTFVHPETGVPLVTVEVSGGAMNNVFAVQSADVVADYGRRLLNDTKSFFNGQPFSVNVVSKYETSDADGCTRSPNWCYLRGYNQAGQAWSVVWTYVVGTSTDGSDSVQTWNAAP